MKDGVNDDDDDDDESVSHRSESSLSSSSSSAESTVSELSVPKITTQLLDDNIYFDKELRRKEVCLHYYLFVDYKMAAASVGF
jgi:hypothetical protein